MTLEEITSWFLAYKYVAIYAGSILEGPVIMTAAGLLVKLEIVRFWPVYVVLILGDLTGDLLWYWIGHSWAHGFVRRFGRFVSIDEPSLERVKGAFHRHHEKILFLSKITMGFGFAVVILMVAGMVRVPLRKFILLNAAGQCIWTLVLMAVGYFFGNLYLVVNEGFRTVTVIAFFVTVAALVFGAGKYVKQQIILRSQ